MTTDTLRANVAALKALPGILLGPQWRMRLSSLGSDALFILALLAQMDWSQGDLALLIPVAWKPLLTKVSLLSGIILKAYEFRLKRRADLARSIPPAL